MIRSAIQVARTSPSRFMHCALFYKGGALLCAASNTFSEHAEARALRQLGGWEGRAPKLLSIRVGNDNKLKNAKPCVNCQKLLRSAGIKKVLFSGDDGLLHRMKL